MPANCEHYNYERDGGECVYCRERAEAEAAEGFDPRLGRFYGPLGRDLRAAFASAGVTYSA